jgi:hypothetical protein
VPDPRFGKINYIIKKRIYDDRSPKGNRLIFETCLIVIMKRIHSFGSMIKFPSTWAIAAFCAVFLLAFSASAEWDLTGTWESRYQFGPIEEVMTANIQQVGENAVGSFKVKPASGEEYSGVIFGSIDGDNMKVNYLSIRASTSGDPLAIITFTDGRVMDENTLRGTYYVQDSDMNAISGPYEAKRIK